jgi:hypothetical protein
MTSWAVLGRLAGTSAGAGRGAQRGLLQSARPDGGSGLFPLEAGDLVAEGGDGLGLLVDDLQQGHDQGRALGLRGGGDFGNQVPPTICNCKEKLPRARSY